MTPQKATPSSAQKSASASQLKPTTTTAASTGRKPWIKKTPVEVVLEQIGKQEAKVADMRKELGVEERELAKLQQARKILEST
jgi:hypothetical protein